MFFTQAVGELFQLTNSYGKIPADIGKCERLILLQDLGKWGKGLLLKLFKKTLKNCYLPSGNVR
jgi:hypothetical protein